MILYYLRNNKNELKEITHNNTNGEKIKVVIISKAGSEGLDFKNIRQIHILEPWYNINRIDQIIGRGVRNLSHCELPYTKRNVEIFLYGTRLIKPENIDKEAIDMYMYRYSENKAKNIGIVSRTLKKNAMDCLLTRYQQNANNSSIKKLTIKNKVNQILSSNGLEIKYELGNKNNSFNCDFMVCDYQCNVEMKDDTINKDTYNYNFMVKNNSVIIKKIKNIFKEFFSINKKELIQRINSGNRKYSNKQIDSAINVLINDKTMFINDMFNNKGRLINISNMYLFQPLEIDDTALTNYERRNEKPFTNLSHGIVIDIKQKAELKESEGVVIFEEIKKIYNALYEVKRQTIKKESLKNFIKTIKIFKQYSLGTIEKGQKKEREREKEEMVELFKQYAIHHYLDAMKHTKLKPLFIYINKITYTDIEDINDRKLIDILLKYFNKNIISIKDNKFLGITRFDLKQIKFSYVDIEKEQFARKKSKNDYTIEKIESKFKTKIEKVKNNKLYGYMDENVGEKYKGKIEFKIFGYSTFENQKIKKYMKLITSMNDKLPYISTSINYSVLLLELYLRYLDDINFDNKRYFYNSFEWKFIRTLKIKLI